MLSIATLLSAVVLGTLLVSVAIVKRLQEREYGHGGRWQELARSRFVLGIPWGTLVVIAFVLAVYLFVQDGISDFSDPVTLPYRSWSYFYPLGIATASFSHAGPGHLISNLVGTLVAAPIAEFAWGHYPQGRDADDTADPPWRRPWIRALVVFPLVVIGVGLLTSLFALGPVIGFSGVVFAFAAFALVHYPIVTLIATLGVQSALYTVYSALQNPIHVYVAEPAPPTPPSWAGIAIQGHALGFFIGLVLGIALIEWRNNRPDPFHLWLALVLYAISSGLWQIYWFGEGNSFYLFQGPGVALVVALALVITLALYASERSLFPKRVERFLVRLRGSEWAVDRPLELARSSSPDFGRIHEIAGGYRTERTTNLSSYSRRGGALLVVLLVLAALVGMAIPVNVVAVDASPQSPESAIEIEDYTIEYAEDVENELVSDFGIDQLGEGLEASGVIVASEQRNLWIEAVTEQHLAYTGNETVTVGGPGWRSSVVVERAGWEPVGNEPVYQIRMAERGEDQQVVYESSEVQADVLVENRTITVLSEDGEFRLEVASAETGIAETAAIPETDESTSAAGVQFEHEDGTIYAMTDETVVAVASEETYDG
ncbi:rhomboid family intramembrane serine protease [Natronobacterium texcoconense]|uniref:Membrane associated serine protease, rhomboid family n=1 Tax=Natronobacterium texcoconense TaxID=1095778 RepID=A0A1H1IWB2_NATTX|nr:rhomboid family intramembrane serine protease [Natronobacterium texcoconense]SDR41997.1 Membrane associated serine protease, rhomboid family [Natronobacterium texcoconense]